MTSLINTRNAALAFAASFVGAGLLGFIPNPLVAPDGLFAVNTMHNLVHIITGAAFLIGAVMLGKPQLTLRVIGGLYVAVSALGFVTTGDMLLGLIHINTADRWLHVGLAIAILAAGFAIPDKGSSDSARAQTA